MTFLEAAIEILRHADEALHFSEVARRAVEENLLSHVGRDPEAAMRSCLNSAARTGRGGQDPLIEREKPGFYGIRSGAVLPEPPPRPVVKAAKKSSDSESTGRGSKAKPKAKTTSKKAAGKTMRRKGAEPEQDGKKRRRTRTPRGEAPEPESVEVLPTRKKKTTKKTTTAAKKTTKRSTKKAAKKASKEEPVEDAALPEQPELPNVEFSAPSGSGLDGVTDVALVMANAMSRLVEERPELREELDAMQQTEIGETVPDQEPEPNPEPAVRTGASNSRPSPQNGEERGGRRRRRRRRRGKRVDWSSGGENRAESETLNSRLLDGVATVLEDSGPRSLHVRQIAESLANQGLLGGEISEIERAVTAAILLDIRETGRASRFVARGDARYQLQGTRLPEKAAASEKALRAAVRELNQETHVQLVQWLRSLGARALESLVRMYLHREHYQMLSALPPNRGVGKLVVDDPESEDEEHTLVLVVPRRTTLESKLWEGELERNSCGSMLVFAMGDLPEEGLNEHRVIAPEEFSHWLRQRGLGVAKLDLTVDVLDPTVIESIAGLDT